MSWTASHDRPLRLRMRRDLVAKVQEYLGRRYWVVKDPLRLRYYRFEEEEYSILQSLDGERSLEQIRKGFERQFAPQKLTQSELHRLITMLHRAALLISDLPGQGEQLLERTKKESKKKWLSAATQILSFRLRGVNPDRTLTWIEARFCSRFRRWAWRSRTSRSWGGDCRRRKSSLPRKTGLRWRSALP
jgi:putative peptide zinc metalloprotease protein